MNSANSELQLLQQALGGMPHGPENLSDHLQFHGRNQDDPPLNSDNVVEKVTLQAGSELGREFQLRLITWDHVPGDESASSWTEGTRRNTAERRALILKKLGLETGAVELNATFRVALIEEPLVIAEEHEDWYPKHVKPFYWNHYQEYLADKRELEPAGLVSLDLATTQAIARLSDPQRSEAYQAKGLVVGYVQSGKTTHFTGVIAKAIDAGYRLIIVLSGTQNMLRNQTQRRIDMELVGKDQIRPSSDPGQPHDYDDDPDWDAWFVEYGDLPRSLAGTNITRLTGDKQDFRHLAHGIADILNPGLERFAEDKPLYDIANLEKSNARLIVAKKNSPILKKLVRNLQGMPEMVRQQVPAIVIDDESDQASINTLKPNRSWIAREQRKRTAINARISEILDILKRSQYLGYTATPTANVFVDPDDPMDIFPKDFLISLPRPPGYMGVADFHDLDDLFDPNTDHELTNERAHIRSIRTPHGEDDADLQAAIDTFVLTGAIKLFRLSIDDRHRFHFRHHTMLAHESVRREDHRELAERICEIWDNSGYRSDDCYNRLEELFKNDLQPVSADRGTSEEFPKNFQELWDFIGIAVDRVEGASGLGTDVALVVNSDRDSTNPDFDKTDVWKIIVGGSKLSRGYTIEGLTVSWFRRRSTYEDTIMQMGRWFGFRPGYRDLVRLYIARKEPFGRKRHMDLYEAFEGICRDEEALRQELRRYEDGGITPRQVPPLIQLSHPDLLPAAPNKMWNAEIRSKNFGGSWIDRTLVSFDEDDLRHNADLINKLVEKASCRILEAESLAMAKPKSVTAATWVVNNERMLEMLKGYRWREDHRETLIKLELEFLAGGELLDPEIDDWVVFAPLLTRYQDTHEVGGQVIPIQERSVRGGGAVNVFSTPADKFAAEIVIGKRTAEQPSDLLAELTTKRRGVLLLYPTWPLIEEELETPVMGLCILPPTNSKPRQARFSVRRPEVDDIAIDPVSSIARP